MKSLAALLITISVAIPAFAQSAAPSALASPQDPYKIYRDEAAKLSLTYPTDMQVQETANAFASVKQQTPEKLKAATDCIVIPFTALRRPANGIDMYMEFRADAGCLGMPINEASMSAFITSALSSSLAQMGNPNVADDLTKSTLGGHPAYSQSGKVAFKINPQMTFYVTMVCIAANPNVLCMQLTSTSESGLQALRQLTIQFDGQPSQPLIASATPPKP